MAKTENTFVTFANDKPENVYENTKDVNEYNTGFIAGTLINCRSINTALRMTTMVDNAFLNAIGIGNAEEYPGEVKTGYIADVNTEVSENTDSSSMTGVSFKDLDVKESIGNRSTLFDVTNAIFNAMRNFKPKFANCAEMVYCRRGEDIKPTASINTADRKYYHIDDAFVHLNGKETVNGDKSFKNNVHFGSRWANEANASEELPYVHMYGVLDCTTSYSKSDADNIDISKFSVSKEAGLCASNYSGDAKRGSILRPGFTIGHNHVSELYGSALGWNNIVSDSDGTHQYTMCLGNENYCNDAKYTTVIGTGNKSTYANTSLFGKDLASFEDGQIIIGSRNLSSYTTKPSEYENTSYASSFIITANAGTAGVTNGVTNMIEGYSWVNSSAPTTVKHALYLNCSTYCSSTITSNTFNTTSDRRLKENITDYNYHDSILDIPVKEFDMKSDGSHHIGCIAQDLQKKYPELVSEDANGYLRIEESKLVYLLMEEVKMLKARIEDLEKGCL